MNVLKTAAIGFLLLCPLLAAHAAGPWWDNYRFSIQPVNGVDKPQTDVLQNGIPIHKPVLSAQRSPSASDAALRFTTRAGFRYQPQMSATLDPPAWTNYGVSYTGVSQVVNVWMWTSANHHGFFRLNVTPLPSTRQASGEFFDSRDQQGTQASSELVPDSVLIRNGPGDASANPAADPAHGDDAANRLR
jgi:hypothetical protein